jgi:hypothetical protein
MLAFGGESLGGPAHPSAPNAPCRRQAWDLGRGGTVKEHNHKYIEG